MMKNNKALFIAQAGIIAAIYVVVTYFVNALNLANGAIQVRLSEALCILPVFTPAAIPGLFIGCLISNTITGCVIWDIIFGSLATLCGAVGTYMLRETKFVYTLPPVFANAVVVPLVLKYAYGLADAWPFLVCTVAIGEVISVCFFGSILRNALKKPFSIVFNEQLATQNVGDSGSTKHEGNH